MNCEEVQAQLLEYLDTSLDRISTKHVEVHLSRCAACRVEADSLSDCVRQVAALPIVDPPLGFAQRVMAHAREIDLTPTIWQRLALLMRNQIPLQAAAVVLIAVFSAYLYQTIDSPPLHRSAPPPSEMAAVTAKAQEATSDLQIATANSSAVEAVKQSPPNRSRNSTTAIAKAPVSQSQGRPAGKAEMESPSASRFEKPQRPPISVQEVATGRDSSRLIGGDFRFGEIPLGRSPQFALRPPRIPLNESMSWANEPNADFEFVVRRRTAQRRESVEIEDVEPVRRSSEAEVSAASAGRRAAPSPFASAMMAETRWFTVAPEHFEQFKKDLTAETHIESENAKAKKDRDSSQNGDRPLAIKVIILPANDP